MRCRTLGSSVNLTICWTSALPPSSAGWALPAMTIWIGRSLSSSSGREPLAVAQHQGQPLVRGHPPGEADGEHLGVERGGDPAQLGLGGAALDRRTARSRLADLGDQVGPQVGPGLPDLAGVDRSMRVQPSSSSSMLTPISRAEQLLHLAGDPGRGVDAVGDRRDRHLGLLEARPQPGEHAAADLAVQDRDAVGPLAQAQAHVGHVVDARVTAARARRPGRGCGRRATTTTPYPVRSRTRSARAGTGRCRRGPACGW